MYPTTQGAPMRSLLDRVLGRAAASRPEPSNSAPFRPRQRSALDSLLGMHRDRISVRVSGARREAFDETAGQRDPTLPRRLIYDPTRGTCRP